MIRRPLSSFVLVTCLVMVSNNLASCSPSPKHVSDADIDFLASDAHVVVGDVPLVLPFIALTGYVAAKPSFSLNRQQDRHAATDRLEAFRKAATNPQGAAKMDQLEIEVYAYGWNDLDPQPFKRICARLSRQWSKSVCDDPWAALKQAMPENRFYVVDDRKFDAFDNHFTVGGERVSDQLHSMQLRVNEASVVCDRNLKSSKTNFCTAAIPIKQHLAAVWTVWDSTGESHSRQAEREGKAITAFVRHAIGPSEDFPALFAEACRLRNPKSSIGPGGSLCGGPISK
ncbi:MULTISPECIES: hypothetical protein [unclassified Mesorhizobium]|uniref:hypothetical protein n=1 Tax=unclassified Mesorhizobium TaxID=325217 RepID=UPI00112D7D41|nr:MULTISPECIES: hypothetical protein [unclassified Mesorhizobium]MBZ9973872.1 hypothetical protein [Mesorhizobium sp. BR-1-1-10]TPK10136.1 hypothetical protein FJ543_21505 [Mesorhizobium sp. B2-5-7]